MYRLYDMIPYMKLKDILYQNLANLPVPLSSSGMPLEPARLMNGRGGRIPGWEQLNIDIYPPLIFIAHYCDYSDEDIREIDRQVSAVFKDLPLMIQDRSVRPYKVRLKRGEIPEEMIVDEGGLKFHLNPHRGQNPGFFPDMRDGRRLIGELVGQVKERGLEEVNVLNLFAYTCAFSVVSLAAGADKVVNIDMNRRSLDIGRKNHRINHNEIPGGYRNQALFLPHDIFKSFGRIKKEGPYHLIIVDPPPSQKGSFMLMKDYPRLLKRLPQMLHPGGEILLTLNSPGKTWEDFENLIRENLPSFGHWERVSPPEDFAPFEDGRGLKVLIASDKPISGEEQ